MATRRRCSALVQFTLGTSVAFSQVQTGEMVLPKADTIPFLLSDHNNILVPVILNKADTLQLMFHSSFTGVSVTADGLKHCTTLRADEEGIAHSWGGDAQSSVSRSNRLRIGRQMWDSVVVTIDEQSGQDSDGKFGWDLFQDEVLEINYDRNELVLHPSLPALGKDFAVLPFEERDGSLYVEATVTLGDTTITDRFMFHTGYGGTCILGTGFMGRVGRNIALDTLGVKKLSDAYGNVLVNVTTRTPSLTFAGHAFKDLRIQVMDRRSQFADSVLGNDVLRRFNVWIDFRGYRLYLKPNAAMGAAFSDRF